MHSIAGSCLLWARRKGFQGSPCKQAWWGEQAGMVAGACRHLHVQHEDVALRGRQVAPAQLAALRGQQQPPGSRLAAQVHLQQRDLRTRVDSSAHGQDAAGVTLHRDAAQQTT